ncbi:MAG: hypothetical protein R3300_15385 [Candidatus Promineifilaceae bacterium]|nr:hypothetical protein [Candidatus Promineifilaceae bacterium]
MDELVKMISDQANISDAQAEKAVRTVMQYVNKNLPAPVAKQVNNVLRGEQADDLIKGLGQGLSGLLGGKE